MRSSSLTFLFSLVLPLTSASIACVFTSEPDCGVNGELCPSGSTDGGTSCQVGAPGCPCTNSGACDDGLTCIEQLDACIVPSNCDVGAAGCECTAGGTCDEGFICKENFCVSEQPCLPELTGTEGCQCTPGGGCDPGLECLSQTCVDASGVTTTGDGSTGDMSGTTTDMSGSSGSTSDSATDGETEGSTGDGTATGTGG
jgi:hypothetical protein